jgi:hypothetical protein
VEGSQQAANPEDGYEWASNSVGTRWGDPDYCRLCRRDEPHSYRTHEMMVHSTRVARMED